MSVTVDGFMEAPNRELHDTALFGSADLVATFMRLGLIDEFRILVTPVVLGRGTPMSKNIQDRMALKLVNATPWSSGIVALYYQTRRAHRRLAG
jgi:dihydrofolate reductase